MSRTSKLARTLMAVFGIAIATPAVLSLTASVGSASGYMVSSGILGIICNPGGQDDCP